MIVNDNTDLVDLFKTALEHQGIETYTFTDPALALKEVKVINENIKVVLTSGYNFSATDVSINGYDEFLQLHHLDNKTEYLYQLPEISTAQNDLRFKGSMDQKRLFI